MIQFLTKVVVFVVTTIMIIGGWVDVIKSVVPKGDIFTGFVIIILGGINIYWVGSLMAEDIKKSYGK